MKKAKIVWSVNKLLKPLGAQIVRAGETMEPTHDPSFSYMKDDDLRARLVTELSKIARSHFSTRLTDFAPLDFDYASEAREFLTLYSHRPFRDNTGGSGFHNAFWLYMTARTLNPSLIVESGVLRGHTTWLFERACPDAGILGFDINLSRLEHRTKKARFFEHDWSEYQFEHIDRERSLVFFDCHIDHAKRAIEAKQRGFRHLVFDDNPPAHILYAYGLPGFPTARMVWDGLEGRSGNRIEWCSFGKQISYEMDMQEVAEAKRIIQAHEVFPDVGGFTKYGGFSYLTYVRI